MDVTASERSRIVHEWAEVAGVIAGGSALILAGLGIIGAILLAPRPSVAGTPTADPVVLERTIEARHTTGREDGPDALPADALVVSETFQPDVTFRIRAMAAGGRPELCAFRTSPRTIELGHRMGCVDEVWIVRPAAIACGVLDESPDAATLAKAMLSRPDLGAVDLGPIVPGRTVPADLFADAPTGRVLQVVGVGPFGGRVDDPDECRLLPDPTTRDDTIEIRRDLTARFVLFDVDGELVVIRAGFGGHDRDTALDGFERGYGRFSETTLDHLLESVYDLRFD
jgi:hypothetical protein